GDLTMGAVVGAEPVVPAQRVIPLDFASGLEERLEIVFGGGEAAYGIDDEIDLNAGASTLGESVDDLAGQLAAMKNVGFEVDAALGLAHGGDLGLVKVVAVRDDVDLVSSGDFGIYQ